MSNVDFTDSDNVDINIPNLRYLELVDISGDIPLSLIKCNKDTITKLILSDVDTKLYNNSLTVVAMLRLKQLCLASLKMKMKLKLDY